MPRPLTDNTTDHTATDHTDRTDHTATDHTDRTDHTATDDTDPVPSRPAGRPLK